MNVAGFVRAVLLKPIVLVLLVVVGIAAGAVGWMSASTHYESNGSVLVIPPGAGSTDPGKNPFINLGEGTPQLANVLATTAQAPDAQARVAATGAQTGYAVSTLAGDSSRFSQLSPQISFVVSGPDAVTAQRGAQELITVMREKLRKMQVDAGVVVGGTLAEIRVSVDPSPGAEVPANSARDAASYAMGAVALVVVLLLVGVSARQLIRRRPEGPSDLDTVALDSRTAAAAASVDPAVGDAGAAFEGRAPEETDLDSTARPARPRRIAPPQRPSSPARSYRSDWTSAEEPLPEPVADDSATTPSPRRVSPQVRWARPANRDDQARPRV